MSKTETVYYVEGECEKNFINSFKSNKALTPGKVLIVNFWELSNINKVIRLLPRGKKADIFVVFDTDVISETERFSANIKTLSKSARKIVLLPQTFNFEDEIVFAFSLQNTRIMTRHLYQLDTIEEFKTKFAQDKNLVNNLNSKDFDLKKLWIRGEIAERLNLPAKNILWGVEHALLES